MLNQENKLFFPFLLSTRDCGPGTFNVYRLDWSRQSNALRSRIGDSVSLPPEYEDKIAKLLFGLNSGYLIEIRRCSRAAIDEFNIHRQVDGSMQNLCLKPGISYVETAFRLLADSILDEVNDYYTRDYTVKTIAFHAMLYKFWCYQTDKEHIYQNARLYDLSQASRAAQKLESPNDDLAKSTNEISRFLDAIKEHQNTF